MNAADNLNWLVGRFVQQVAAVRQAVVVSSDGSACPSPAAVGRVVGAVVGVVGSA